MIDIEKVHSDINAINTKLHNSTLEDNEINSLNYTLKYLDTYVNFINNNIEVLEIGMSYLIKDIRVDSAYLIRHNIHEIGLLLVCENYFIVIGLRSFGVYLYKMGEDNINLNNRLYLNERVILNSCIITLSPIPIKLPIKNKLNIEDILIKLRLFIITNIPITDGFIDFQRSLSSYNTSVYRLTMEDWWK